MALAANVSLVTVTGEYVDYQGTPIAGQILFRVPTVLRNAVADQILIPSTLYVTLDASGTFSATLPATDDTDFHEAFVYTITESFQGGRTWQTALPASPSTVDISDLVPAYSGETFISLAAGSQYVALNSRVTAAETLIADPIYSDPAALAADLTSTEGHRDDALASQAAAEASQADAEATGVLFPHPFTFTGVG